MMENNEFKIIFIKKAIQCLEDSRDRNSNGSISIPHLDRADLYWSNSMNNIKTLIKEEIDNKVVIMLIKMNEECLKMSRNVNGEKDISIPYLDRANMYFNWVIKNVNKAMKELGLKI